MKTFTPEHLAEILRKHGLWLRGENGGEKADLSDSNLSDSNLRGSNLSGSNLSYSDLRGSDLSYSDLSGSNLSYSDLSGSDLSGSDLRGSTGLVYIGQRTDRYQFYAVYNESGKQWYIHAGCRYKTIAEYREHVLTYECDTKRQETSDLLDFAEKRINLLGRISA